MNTVELTAIDFSHLLEKQKKYFSEGYTLAVKSRREALLRLKKSIELHESEILRALHTDLRKSEFEAWATELGIVYQEIQLHYKNLPKWAKGKRVPTNQLIHFWSVSRILPQPYGQTLIIAPWNYPFQLVMMPLIGALSAGNTAVIKPSEFTPTVASVIEKIISKTFDDSYVKVLPGGPEVSKALLELKWDKIFFTGSPRVGKIVYEAAAKHLTPVVLELGGKSPTIVTEKANIDVAARRIVWGKFINAGQTCIAPDYILVHRSIKEPLIEKLKEYIRKFYGQNPAENAEYPAIVNRSHAERITNYIRHSKVLYGGHADINRRYIEPTVVEATADQPVMQEEIFGPVLPILTFETVYEAIQFINERPKPLALYIFSEDSKEQDLILQKTSSGSAAINEVVMQVANDHLPFGGVGNSGMGNYHGKRSFDCFSHERSVLYKSTWIDIPLRYPPFGNKIKWVKNLLK
ncbi:aldehyde dehydrogenase [Thermaurantimonas aggregans]|uniref:Aldehyde dehydrogenase n=1 Tax=Thermaurantimonas aggregans TaxID=2173829 RepID=A0A401XI02_9FLAO|nr:aldehyde dehydrogenase [Thermaurantimonas aggregans]MCX8149174.1 aldehyde dehydrogenase [Thermaurantimonas aggregans]GCD76614.1 aldehyde dehydrogenase [Thermaurantimonas aggregans]